MLKVFEAFAGVGSQRMALRNIGIEHEVVAIAEIDKFAIQSYDAIHGPTKNLGDISKINPSDIPDHDLFTYSFPCVDVSVAGKQAGIVRGETRSGLLYECERVIETKKPKYLLLENVKNLVGKKHRQGFDEWLEYLETQGYTNYWRVENATEHGTPQNRERVFVISIRGEHKPFTFKYKRELTVKLKDVLETNVGEKFYLSDEIVNRFVYKQPSEKSQVKVVGTTAPSFRKIGQRDVVYSGEGLMGSLVATDYKQPKQIIEGMIEKEGWLDCIKRVYSHEGVSPTLTNMQGGHREPKILETLPIIATSRGRNVDNPSDRTSGITLEQRLEINKKGITNTLTTVQKDNYVIERSIETIPIINATKKGLQDAKPFDNINLEQPNSKTRRGRVGDQISNTLMTGCQMGVVERDFRIRKLTPRECWRLMNFTDDDFYKAQSVCSNSQLYKQAGNSIVVNVLEDIFRELFKG